MKNLFCLTVSLLMLASGLNTASFASNSKPKKAEKSQALDGSKSRVQTMQMSGIEMSETLNDDGTDIIKRPYRWFAGLGEANNRQVAIEMAQREAYATISRTVENAVSDSAERGNITNGGVVIQALRSHWEQVSHSMQRGCEPYGDVVIEYNKSTKMYNATAKVAMRGDRFTKLLDSAANYAPDNLSGEELDRFVEINSSIIEAAKGN